MNSTATNQRLKCKMATPSVHIIQARAPEHFEMAKRLFTAYQQYLGEDLCFQSFEEELGMLPAMYGSPQGVLLLAMAGAEPAGCVGVRTKAPGICEMKRLFVLPAFQGLGIGRRLAEESITRAKSMHYHTMVLDTLERLTQALALYHSLAFVPIPPYYHNPLPGVVYLQKVLT
jgi:putative acetyltransferase